MFSQFMNGMGGMGGAPGMAEEPEVPDTAEKVHISGLSLLKMLKHGRAGVPMEVMGLMLGQFVDDYTITCLDVFAMPQHGTGVSVEAVDPVFQTKMLDMLKQTGRPEVVVGWYHSHPGFGCWLSGVDMNTQQSFEQLNKRAVAVVIDPIQSVKGKVVIDAFRLINPQRGGSGMMMMMMGGGQSEPRQITSHIGHLQRPSTQAKMHGLDRFYYSMVIDWRKSDMEEQMLQNLNKADWQRNMTLMNYDHHQKESMKTLHSLERWTELYAQDIRDEEGKTEQQVAVERVGKIHAKKRMQEDVQKLLTMDIVQSLGMMLATVMF